MNGVRAGGGFSLSRPSFSVSPETLGQGFATWRGQERAACVCPGLDGGAEQNAELQQDALAAAGCWRVWVFTDHVSGAKEDRPELGRVWPPDP